MMLRCAVHSSSGGLEYLASLWALSNAVRITNMNAVEIPHR